MDVLDWMDVTVTFVHSNSYYNEKEVFIIPEKD